MRKNSYAFKKVNIKYSNNNEDEGSAEIETIKGTKMDIEPTKVQNNNNRN